MNNKTDQVIYKFCMANRPVPQGNYHYLKGSPMVALVLRLNSMFSSLNVTYVPDSDIANWMVESWLENNKDKADVALFETKQQLAKIDFDHIDLLESYISFSKDVQDLGVIFD